jgi:hypothetical protein
MPVFRGRRDHRWCCSDVTKFLALTAESFWLVSAQANPKGAVQ